MAAKKAANKTARGTKGARSKPAAKKTAAKKPAAKKTTGKKAAAKKASRKPAAKKTTRKPAKKAARKRSASPSVAKPRTATTYEQQQIADIAAWRDDNPGVLAEGIGVAIEPVAWLVRKMVPQSAIRRVLDSSNTAAVWLTDTDDVLRNGGVDAVEAMRAKDLALCDRLANDVHNWAIGIAAVEGAATGVPGIFGAPIDIPALITIALRTIHKVGACYGYETDSDTAQQFVLAVLAAGSCSSVEERTSALEALTATQRRITRAASKDLSDKAASRALGKEVAIVSAGGIAKQLGVNVTKRRALAAIPWIGALIGGSVNSWYVKEVGWAARRAYQELWLAHNAVKAG